MENSQSKKIVKVLPRGQITIPVSFRRTLDIDKNSLLKAFLRGNALVLKPIKLSEKDMIRNYSKEEINKFLEEDKLDKKIAQKAKRFLKEFES